MVALTEGFYIADASGTWTALHQYGKYLVETRDGVDDTPAKRGENTTLVGRHGDVWRRKRFGPGRKTITLGVHGCLDENFTVPDTGTAQRALYERYLDELLRLLTPLDEQIEVLRVLPDGSHHVASCEVVNPITPATLGDTYGKVQVELVIPGSFWRDEDARPYRLRYDTAGANEQTVEAYSLAGQTAPCSDAVVTVTGPCTSVTLRDVRNGSGFGYGLMSGGQVLEVDVEGFTATLDGNPVLTDLTLYAGTILEVSPAPTINRGPDLTVNAPGKASGFEVVIEARRSWLR